MLEIYRKIWDRINNYETITIFTHLNPDGDTIGTSIALKRLIELNTKNIKVKISGDKYPNNLKWLPSNDLVSDEYINSSIAILVDGSSIKRTFDKRILNAQEIIKIDHHHPEGNEWSLAIEGDNYPAAGEIIYEMIQFLNLKHEDKDIYNSLFVSIWTDTSGLIERNPTKRTFDAIEWLEATGLKREEIITKLDLTEKEKTLINKYVENTTIVNKLAYKINDEIITNDLYRPTTDLFYKRYEAEVYIFATKNPKNKYRVGFRSKGYDVSKIAEKFGGGGHVTSAGTEVDTKDQVQEVINYVIKELENDIKK